MNVNLSSNNPFLSKESPLNDNLENLKKPEDRIILEIQKLTNDALEKISDTMSDSYQDQNCTDIKAKLFTELQEYITKNPKNQEVIFECRFACEKILNEEKPHTIKLEKRTIYLHVDEVKNTAIFQSEINLLLAIHPLATKFFIKLDSLPRSAHLVARGFLEEVVKEKNTDLNLSELFQTYTIKIGENSRSVNGLVWDQYCRHFSFFKNLHLFEQNKYAEKLNNGERPAPLEYILNDAIFSSFDDLNIIIHEVAKLEVINNENALSILKLAHYLEAQSIVSQCEAVVQKQLKILKYNKTDEFLHVCKILKFADSESFRNLRVFCENWINNALNRANKEQFKEMLIIIKDLPIQSLVLNEPKVSNINKLTKGLTFPTSNNDSVWDSFPILGELKEIDLSETDIQDLSFLQELPNLKSVKLRNCSKITNWNSLKNLKKLKEIDLSKTKIENLSFLSGLTDLEKVNLSFTLTSDEGLKFLGNLSNLEKVNLNFCTHITNLSPLANLKKLKVLKLDLCVHIQDLSFLKELPNLERVNLRSCAKLTNICIPANLKQLKKINLSLTFIKDKDIKFLGDLPNLEELNLNTTRNITNLEALAKLKLLKRLDLEFSNIQDFSFLKGLSNLEKLTTSSNLTQNSLNEITKLKKLKELTVHNIHDLRFLSGLSNLEKVSLINSINIKNWNTLANLHQLKEISLSGNSNIKTLNDLENLQNLESVEMKNCLSLKNYDGVAKVKRIYLQSSHPIDLKSLNKLENLEEVTLNCCSNIRNWDALANLKQLKMIDLRYSNFEDLKSLNELQNLEEVTLEGCSNIKNWGALTNLNQLKIINLKETNILFSDLMYLSDLSNLEKVILSNGGEMDKFKWPLSAFNFKAELNDLSGSKFKRKIDY